MLSMMTDMSGFMRVDVETVKKRHEILKNQETAPNWAHTVLEWYDRYADLNVTPIIMHNPYVGEWIVTTEESLMGKYH